MLLVIKHVKCEGPGTLKDFLESKGQSIEVIELEDENISRFLNKGREIFCKDLSKIDAIIILGGPMNVYEEDKYPFLKDENEFIKQALGSNIPILGICLGSQLIAKACGASVKKAKIKEIGWSKVELTEDGVNDRLFKGLDREIDVFQWHEDTFNVPADGKLLATSSDCTNQAFKINDNAYGFQFHIEVTEKMIDDWTKEYCDSANKELEDKAKEMISKYRTLKERFENNTTKICKNFLAILGKEYLYGES